MPASSKRMSAAAVADRFFSKAALNVARATRMHHRERHSPMRNLATTTLALLGLLGSVAVAAAGPNGTGSGNSGPSVQEPSNQTVIFHYVPSAAGGRECLDGWSGGCKLRNAPPAPPTASGSIAVPGIVAGGAVFAQLYWVV